MNKETFCKKVAKNGDFYISHVYRYFDAICETILEVMDSGEAITIANFGTFTPVEKKRRKTFLNGVEYTVEPYKYVAFRLSPNMKRNMRRKMEITDGEVEE